MTFGVIFTALMALLLLGYYIGKKRSIRLSDKSNQRLHSLPQQYDRIMTIRFFILPMSPLVVFSYRVPSKTPEQLMKHIK
jgi:hypothetical protein